MNKKKKDQLTMFDDVQNTWQKEWQDMPEFIQEDLTSERKLIVHFRNNADLIKFAELIGQRITQKQPSLWFPQMEIRKASDKRYTDES
jgi:hypothetical protein